ncbi:efflux transporter outer membrane subunit [Acuticoccus mangrovi]|uniref:Efflux transporter outer membrane subunit n=1 Tax=Acuticoccus mangrovi TaxID=2796142 RepID=A0A934MJB2_9HYPH|nr:efflux transporter outer membrane subunit [Acuticoccus mangrovi]MBJ3778720.1 efflux transporter outer membrane subunit [Acuticoccus mangrovi]
MKRASIALLLLVSGCMVGPDYEEPNIALTTRFVGGDASIVGPVGKKEWWRDYRDPYLSELVDRGLEQNLDVAAALEVIREAEANVRTTGLAAAVDGGADLSFIRSGGGETRPVNTRTADLSGSFIVDLFGGIRRGRQSAEASLGAAQADLETTRLAWLAEIIAAYSDARFYQEALALTRLTISDRVETVKITREQYAAGATTEYDVAEAEALLAQARAQIPEYEALFNANVFAIATLMNESAAPILAKMRRGSPMLKTPGGGNSGLPAELLHNRPDVRSAERTFAAAVYSVGVAEADLYPALTLDGSLTFEGGTNTWSFGPSLTIPVLNQPALRATRDAAASEARQAEIAWRQVVMDAVEDVQVAQSNLQQYRRRTDALRMTVRSYERALSLARNNYAAGAITLIDLLDTDRSTATARISAASAANSAAQEWATLQIAVGAGAAVVAP